QEVIRQIDGGAIGDGTIARCPATMSNDLPAGVNRQNCVIVQRYSLRLRFVVADRAKAEGAIESPDVEYREPLNSQDTRLVYIALNPQLTEINPVDSTALIDPSKTIEAAQ